MSTLWASSRDASVWDRPNVRSRKRVHIAVNVVDIGRPPGWSTVEQHGEAACDPTRMPLDMSASSPAETIPEVRRCRRPGCAKRWPTYTPEVTP